MADTATISPDQQSAQDYISNNGGSAAYIENQRYKYGQAQSSGDTNMINKLNADAARTGYSYAPSTNVSYPTATPTPTPTPTPNTTPASTALGVQPNAATPQMQTVSSQWQANPNNDPTITANNNALHQQNLQAASQNGLTYNPSTGTYSQVAAPQGDGTVHMNVNGQAASDEKVFKGTSFSSARDLATQLGLPYSADPKTGEISIGGTKVSPTSYDKNGDAIVGVRSVADALGYKIGYDDKSKTITITGKPKDTGAPTGTGTPTGDTQLVSNNTGYNSPIQSIGQGMPQMQSMTPWTPPDTSGFQDNMMPYQTFNPDYNQYYQQAHNQLDPQFNANNQKLMDKQNMDIQKSDESMNRRGIFSSGVAQATENDLRAKTTNALAAGFTAQMGHIEKVAETLFNNAYKQYQQGNTFALKNNQDQITNMLNVEKQSFSQWAQTQKLDQAQYGYALKAWDQMAGMIMKDSTNQMNNNHFNQTMDFNQYKFDHPSAAQQLPYQNQTANNIANNANSAANNAANNQSRENIALLPYQHMTQYQQATTQEKQTMDTATNYFKQQGINIDTAKLMEAITHNRNTEGLTANGQANTAAHNSATEKETNRHNTVTETNATNVASQNKVKETNTNLYNIWKATGKAPAGIDGVAEGTAFVHPTTTTKIDSKESYNQSTSIKSQLDTKRLKNDGTINKDKATQFIDANKDILTDSDYRDLKDWVSSKFTK